MIGLLTILGFSLYDTVIVFDKVEENTHGFEHTTRRTFAEQANLAINQTFMRSINTSLISVLPIMALMVVAVWLLGVGTLKDLALVQLVGVIVGTLLVDLLRHPAAGDAARAHRARSHAHPAGAQPPQAAPRPPRWSQDAEPEAVGGRRRWPPTPRARQARARGAARPADRQPDRTTVG